MDVEKEDSSSPNLMLAMISTNDTGPHDLCLVPRVLQRAISWKATRID